MLRLPLTRLSTFILVRPHYPENVGAAARAIKTMGITDLVLVKPSRLAVPEHEMAKKMAVKSWDVLEGARRCSTLAEALLGMEVAFATTSRRGVTGNLPLRKAAWLAQREAEAGRHVAFVFGNEKTGLSDQDRELCTHALRIPMAADQPSINLAQATQLVAYELFIVALEARERNAIGIGEAAARVEREDGHG